MCSSDSEREEGRSRNSVSDSWRKVKDRYIRKIVIRIFRFLRSKFRWFLICKADKDLSCRATQRLKECASTARMTINASLTNIFHCGFVLCPRKNCCVSFPVSSRKSSRLKFSHLPKPIKTLLLDYRGKSCVLIHLRISSYVVLNWFLCFINQPPSL